MLSVLAFPASMYRKAEAGGDGISGEYSYNGHVYLTQTRLWFYSCTLMSFVNTVSKRQNGKEGLGNQDLPSV